MMRFHYVIKLIGRLLRNAIIWRSKHDLAFHREDDGVWYVDFPDWPFAHHNLAMVGGADKLCSYLADGKQTIRVAVVASQHPISLSGYSLLTKTYSNLFYGADYDATGFENLHRSVWIYPVTLFVLGRYPKDIYVKTE
jgi:hypothetical protein